MSFFYAIAVRKLKLLKALSCKRPERRVKSEGEADWRLH